MNHNYLIESAQKIPAANEKAAKEYNDRKDILIAEINNYMESRSDLNLLIGESNIEMMKDNHANHVRFIHSILKNPNAEVLTETVLGFPGLQKSWFFKQLLGGTIERMD